MALVALVCCVIWYDHSPGTQTHELLSLSAETLMLIRSWSLRWIAMNVFLCVCLRVCVCTCVYRSVSQLSFLINRQISHQRSFSFPSTFFCWCFASVFVAASPPSLQLPLLFFFQYYFHPFFSRPSPTPPLCLIVAQSAFPNLFPV